MFFVFSWAFMFSTAFKLAMLVFLTPKRKKPVRLGQIKHSVLRTPLEKRGIIYRLKFKRHLY